MKTFRQWVELFSNPDDIGDWHAAYDSFEEDPHGHMGQLVKWLTAQYAKVAQELTKMLDGQGMKYTGRARPPFRMGDLTWSEHDRLIVPALDYFNYYAENPNQVWDMLDRVIENRPFPGMGNVRHATVHKYDDEYEFESMDPRARQLIDRFSQSQQAFFAALKTFGQQNPNWNR